MTDEPKTLPDVGGTDNVTPSENDTPDTYDYWDPEDDQDTPEIEEDAGTDEVVTEEPEATEEVAEETEAEIPAATVVLKDGTKVTHDELVKGYYRQADYTRDKQALSNEKRTLAENASRIEGITNAFVDHLASMLPPEPDTALALRDPNAYTRQKVVYEAALAQIQKLAELGTEPKQIKDGLAQQDTQALVADENRKLSERFPEVATPEGREKFFTSAADAAQEAGFSMEDLNGVKDHRLFTLAYWANEGMKAAKARETAKAKVANVPPATLRKPGQTGQPVQNADAMRKLARSGSIRDALKVDWD